MRIFVALDIDQVIRERIHLFVDGIRVLAPDVRWVRPESLHVTLKFIGNRSTEEVAQVTQALVPIEASNFTLSIRGCGFFPNSKAPRVFWLGVEASAELRDLAKSVEVATAALGLNLPEEDRYFSPHLTVARRASSGSERRHEAGGGNQGFQLLQKNLEAMALPDFGTMTAREFFLYESQPGRGGSRYAKISRFGLA